MSLINKAEATGIFLSIAVMAVALVLIRFEFVPGDILSLSTTESQSAVVIVSQEGNQEAALANAIIEGATSKGKIQKLIIDDVLLGRGPLVKDGDEISVNYIGRLQNGQEFDNSYVKGEPFTFTVGGENVIKAWDIGVVGMQPEGQRVLVVPPDMAYGSDGFGPIPPNATLIFAIELLSIN